ncbi:type II toxin-antitoxin system PemK/MazF family toxin [Candidatus Saccharibacteria bacterium]|nr:type II toxin-antitoxin system PemK/MazF family toxin [Candidatus Saccharibacteria bacterium]
MRTKDYDSWNIRKKLIQSGEFQKFVHEREIWWCSIGLNIDDEEDGKNEQFERPVLIIKKFNRHIVLAVPLTTKFKDNKYYFNFEHDNVQFAAVLSQIRLLSTKRFSRRVRRINKNLFEQINKESSRSLSLKNKRPRLRGASGA